MPSPSFCRVAATWTRSTLGSLRSFPSLTCISLAAIALSAAPSRAQVKISQVYGAGGNTSSPLLNDYIEIYNVGPLPQDLTGWSVQYAASTGVFSAANTTALPATILAPGQYLLVEEGTGGALAAGQTPGLPPAQATGAIAMSADSFKVALVSSTAFLPTGTPAYAGNPTLVDFVGTGTADWNDAAAAGGAFLAANNAPVASTAHADYRIGCGATDTNSSKDDWAVGFPAPRNTSTALNSGITTIGSALPLTLEGGQSTRLTTTPYRCATNDLGAGTTVIVDLSSIGGGAVTPMLDDGVAPDEVATDGIYTVLATVAAATTTGTKNLLVLVSDGGGNSGGTFIDTEVRPIATPDNDNCSTASAISGPFPATVMADLTGATVESNPIVNGATGGAFTTGMTSRRGVWYTVVGTGNTMTASMCGTLPVFDSLMMVMCGTCDGLTVIGLDDDFCGSSDASQVTWCSQLGTTYYIWIGPFSGAASTNTFTLNITEGAACTTAFPCTICLGTPGPFTEIEPGYGIHTNDGCSSTPNRFTNIATPSFPGTMVRGTARGMIGNRDVDWYRFQATTTDTMTIKLDTLGSQAQAQVFSLSPGGVCPPSPATPLFFTPILLTRCPTGIQSISGPVTAGTWYAVLVIGGISLQNTPAGTIFGGQMPGGTTFQYKMDIAIGSPPANDNCANATSLTLGAPQSAGNTSTATNDGTSTCDATGRDLWYQVTTTSAGTLNVQTCGSAIDTVLAIYPSCGGAEIACNDDCGGTPCGPTSSCLSLPSLPQGNYKLRVSDKNIGAGGAFRIQASFALDSGTPFCFGDGTQAACPCGNSGAIGHGCENSGNTGGAQLNATGTTDVANDTVVLTSSGELPAVFSVFFQGEANMPGASFGDGIRCASGNRLRLYMKVSSPGGVVSAPGPGDPSITARCASLGAPISVGDTRYYQVCYRDPDASFCPLPLGRNYNVSNGQIIVW